MGREPRRYKRQIGIVDAELRSELGWREPLLILRRAGILLRFNQGVERGLLRGGRLEHKQHAIEPRVRPYYTFINRTFVETSARPQRHVACEGDEMRFVNRGGEGGSGEAVRGHRGAQIAAATGEQEQCDKR